MRWLLGQILWIPKILLILLLIFAVVMGFRTSWPDWAAGLAFGGFLSLMLVEGLQQKLLTRRARLPKIKVPRSRPKAAYVAPTAPVVAQKPKERAFATVPVAAAAPAPALTNAASGLPEHLHRFIEQGDTAIHMPAPKRAVKVEEPAKPQRSDQPAMPPMPPSSSAV